MEINIAELLSNFRFATVSYDLKGEKIRSLIELDKWDEGGKQLWGIFPTDIPDASFPLMLKCIDRTLNYYVTIKGQLNNRAKRIRENKEFQAFAVEEIMLARKKELDSNVSVFTIEGVIDFTSRQSGQPVEETIRRKAV